MNIAILSGTIARLNDPRTSQGGNAVRSFRVATRRTFAGKDGEVRSFTDYHNVVAFGANAEKLAEAGEGDAIEVVGSLQTRSYEDKSGSKRYTTEITVGYEGQLTLDGEAPAPARQSAPAQSHPADSAEADLDDEIPF